MIGDSKTRKPVAWEIQKRRGFAPLLVLFVVGVMSVVVLASCSRQNAERGDVLFRKGDFAGAAEEYTHFLETNPENYHIYNNRGNAYLALGNYEAAVGDYSKAIELKPDLPEGYYNRGIAFYAKNDMAEALADFNHAIELKPDYLEAYYSRGLVHRKQGNTDLAAADLNRVLELDMGTEWSEKAREQLDTLGK